MSRSRPAVLVIAGSDSSGGAGLTRDVEVLTQFGVDALCAVTAVTVQTNREVRAVHPVPAELIRAQIEAALATANLGAVKIGMLGGRDAVEAVARSLPSRASMPIVLDPVLVSSSGGALLDDEGRRAMLKVLFPRVTLVTPNVPEAAVLLHQAPADSESVLIEQANELLALGPQAVLVKGGHAKGSQAVDVLVTAADRVERMTAERLDASARGTGCALSSAIAAGLASGLSMPAACEQAKRYVLERLARSSLPGSQIVTSDEAARGGVG